jgi:hypothetical protein
VYAENRVYTSLEATIDDSVASSRAISADSITVHADSGASINSIAGAAALSASLSGKAGVAVSVGLSLAFNSIDTDVLAHVSGARLTTRTAALDVSATASGVKLGEFTLANALERGITPEAIDGLANANKKSS